MNDNFARKIIKLDLDQIGAVFELGKEDLYKIEEIKNLLDSLDLPETHQDTIDRHVVKCTTVGYTEKTSEEELKRFKELAMDAGIPEDQAEARKHKLIMSSDSSVQYFIDVQATGVTNRMYYISDDINDIDTKTVMEVEDQFHESLMRRWKKIE